MARLFDKILGNPSGRLGDVVFRIRKGASIMALRPSSRTSALNDAEKAFRAKFALVVRIAKSINSIKPLKDIWPSSTGRASKCNEIFQANYTLVNSVENLGSVTVAPIFGFNVANAVLTAGASGIQLVTDALGVGIGIDTSIEKYIMLGGVAVLQTPTLPNIPATQVIPFKSIQHNLDLLNPVDLSADFSGGILAMYEGYTDKKVFACLVTLDDAGKAIRYSTTVHN